MNRTLAPSHRRTLAPSSGFTLMELLIVMGIIVLLSGISLVVYNNSIVRARESALRANLTGLRKALDEYHADKNSYPSSLEDLVAEKYIRSVPVDPFTGSADTWQPVMSDADPSNPSAQPGIFDVKSGAGGTSPFDGTRYADW